MNSMGKAGVLAGGLLVAVTAPVAADSTVIVKMPGCNGCTVTAVSSVHPGWDSIDDDRIEYRRAKVRSGTAKLRVPSTRGLSFAIDAGKYDAGGATAMAVLRYDGTAPGATVGRTQAALGKRASFCWAGTSAGRTTVRLKVQRNFNYSVPAGAPGRFTIRVWASPQLATLRDDLNMDPTDDGALGVQQGPFCFDGGQTSSVASRLAGLPAGESVWIKEVGSTWQILRIWRSGTAVRVYRDEGNYPGDGQYCAWGTVRGGRFAGKEQRVGPDPLSVRFGLKRSGARLRTPGLSDTSQENRLPWFRSTLAEYHQLVPESADYDGSWCRTFRPN